MTRSKLKEVVEKGVVSLVCLFYCSLVDVACVDHWILYEISVLLFLGNSQLEYLTYQEIKRNKGIVYSICLSYTVLCKRLSLGHMQINAV